MERRHIWLLKFSLGPRRQDTAWRWTPGAWESCCLSGRWRSRLCSEAFPLQEILVNTEAGTLLDPFTGPLCGCAWTPVTWGDHQKQNKENVEKGGKEGCAEVFFSEKMMSYSSLKSPLTEIHPCDCCLLFMNTPCVVALLKY